MIPRALLLALIPLVATTPGPIHAQAIKGPDAPVPPHRMARVVVEGADSVAFDSTPLNGSEDYDGEAVGSTYFLTGAPGRHRVMAFALRDGKPVILKTTVTFAGPGLDPLPAPDPPPSPAPNPAPKPPPARTELQKIAIEYAYAVPTAARATAARVASGELSTVAEAVAVVAVSRDASRRRLSDALAAALEGAYDPDTGAITDRARVSAVLAELGGLLP